MRKIIAPIALAALLCAACAVPQQQVQAPAPSSGSAPAPASAPDAKFLYAAKCAGCHGRDGSKGLQGKTAEQVATALNGYKAKTYGGAKKEIMEKQAATLTDANVQELAKYIAGL